MELTPDQILFIETILTLRFLANFPFTEMHSSRHRDLNRRFNALCNAVESKYGSIKEAIEMQSQEVQAVLADRVQ